MSYFRGRPPRERAALGLFALAVLLLALLYAARVVRAQQVQILCETSPSNVACSPTTGPSNTNNGYAAWKWAGYTNQMFGQLYGMFGSGTSLQTTGSASASDIYGLFGGVTGTGTLVRSNTPSLTTPSLGAASATSINGSTIPTSAGTLPGSSGSFTVGHCVEVASTSPLEFSDAGAACGTGGGGGGSGTVNSGSANALAYYASSGTAVSGTSVFGANQFAQANGSGVPGPVSGVALTSTALNTEAFTIAGLPTCNSAAEGEFAYVTNGQSSPTYLGTVSTTGSTVAPVFCNGSAWVYH